MRPSIGFRLALGLYYLALGTWFGTTLMMGVAAATTFHTARDMAPVLSDVPATVDEPADYLAGQIVNRAFAGMSVIQCFCAVIVVGVVVLQFTTWRGQWGRRRGSFSNVARVALLVLAVGILCGDLAWTRPRMGELRATLYDETAVAAAREEARRGFDVYHRASERLLGAAALAVGIAVLVSPLALAGTPAQVSET